jgi:penicillin amidase
MRVIQERIAVKGASPMTVELKYTGHGPVIYEDPKRKFAVALKWVGSEPGGAGYLPALALSRAKDWKAFRAAVENYKVPSENLIYADRAGNIGWIAGGRAPVRKGWNGLLPVPGDSGQYEWQGWLPISEHPQKYNPPEHWIATANANILPPGFPHVLGFEFAAPFRRDRVRELLQSQPKFSAADFARMQYDTVSLPARRFQQVLRRWNPRRENLEKTRQRLLNWDARISVDSAEALIYEVWMMILPSKLFGPELGSRVSLSTTLREIEASPASRALGEALEAALAQLEKALGPEGPRWTWGAVHQLGFRHPINRPAFNIDPVPQPGDANTVFAAGWAANRPFAMNHGASFREILDPADWDRSLITNVPGESSDPASPHYRDLFADWTAGRPHPLPYTRKAVEAATTERINLTPGK